ncbi:MAG: hypothetical protein ACRC5T_02680 [Cetobacterium sp.]
MIKLQIDKLTLKIFLFHWIVAIILVVISIFDILKESDFKEKLIMLGIFPFFPGMLGSVLLIATGKEILKVIKKKNYLAILAITVFIFFYAKIFFKL